MAAHDRSDREFYKLQWDVTIFSSITISLMLLYFVQCVRLSYTNAEKRHKLTLITYYAIMANLVSVELRNIHELVIGLYGLVLADSACFVYALNSIAWVFWSIAVLICIFEWNLLGNLISHQKTHDITELDVYKGDYNNKERRMTRCFKIGLGVVAFYHVAKIAYPLSSVITCSNQDLALNGFECQKQTYVKIRLS